MKHIRILLTVLFISVVVLAIAAFSPGKVTTKTLALVEHATSDTITDTGAKDDSVGDILTFANKVYDKDNKNIVANDSGYCMRTIVGMLWECNWTLATTEGSVTVEGPFYDAKDSELAIIGGTGIYADARGSMKLHARDAKGSEYDFVYEFVQ